MKDSKLIIYKLIERKIGIMDFEKWVYSEKELENLLSSDDYLELLSLDYRLPSSLYEAEKILKRHIVIGKYYEWRLRQVLQKIIDKPIDVNRYIEQCYDMYCNGYNFLNNLAMDYGLTVAAPPSDYSADTWDELKSIEQEKIINSLYPGVYREAKRVLSWLDSEKIILTGHDGSYQGIQYKDNRSPEERKATGYHATKPDKKWWKLW